MKEELKTAIVDSIVSRAGEENALLFSGGVDSTLIAKVLSDHGAKLKCYTAGFPGSEDIGYAERVASELGLDLEIIEIKDLEKVVKKVMHVIDMDDVVMVSVAIPLFTACGKIKEKIVFSGLGSEEIFAGYRMYEELLPDYKKIDDLSWERLERIQKTDLYRDRKIAAHFGLEIALPYLDPKVIAAAMKIPAQKKISATQNKIILRKIAEELGVPKFIAKRRKRAAQYGSGTMKEFKKLAKSKGHKYVKDYLAKL